MQFSHFDKTKTKNAIKIRRIIKVMKKEMIFFIIIIIIFVTMKDKKFSNKFSFRTHLEKNIRSCNKCKLQFRKHSQWWKHFVNNVVEKKTRFYHKVRKKLFFSFSFWRKCNEIFVFSKIKFIVHTHANDVNR